MQLQSKWTSSWWSELSILDPSLPTYAHNQVLPTEQSYADLYEDYEDTEH